MNYKASIYNYLFESNHQKYIYNILSTGIAEVNEDIVKALKDNNFSILDKSTIDALLEEGFVVEQKTDEKACFQYYFDRTRYITSADTLTIVFIPTYNCNLRCPYCYEGNDKNKKIIALKNIEAIIEFTKDRIEQSQKAMPIRALEVSLYGGEPMLAKKELRYFCEKMKTIAQKYKLPIYYDMVSNLTLLDDDMIALIQDYNMMIQVSIDGIKEQHDVRRILPNGQGTYDKIIKNLETLLKKDLKDKVIIRLNVDAENIQKSKELFSIMKKYSNDIYFGTLTTYKGYNEQYDKACLDTNCISALLLDTHSIYKEHNLPIPQKFGKKGPCSLNCENKFMIDCYLDVYKCDLLINHPECKVGKIDLDGRFIANENYFKQLCFSPFNDSKCQGCKFLPLCAGGCPAKAYINRQKTNAELTCNCEFDEEQLNACLIDYVQRMVE